MIFSLLVIVFGVPIFSILYLIKAFSVHPNPPTPQKSNSTKNTKPKSTKGTIETIYSPPSDYGDIDEWVNYWGEIK